MAVLLFKQITSLFLMMASGWMLVRLRLLRAQDSHVLSVLSIYIIMPCVIIRSFQIALTARVLQGFILAAAASLLFQLILFLVSLFCGKVLKMDAVERASVVYTNSGNLIITLVIALLGEEWVIYSSAFMCMQQVFMWTQGQAMLSGNPAVNWKKVFLNVNLISIAAGVVLMLTGIRLPDILMGAAGGLAGLIGPVSMLLTGMLLAEADLKAIFRNKRIYMVSLLRLIAIPLLLLPALRLTGLASKIADGHTVVYISFLAAAAPSATMVTQLAELYDRRPEYAGSINAATTLMCIVTMPLMTQLYMLWI